MIENLDKQEALIWKEALEYAYKQDVNLWKETRNFVKYAIEHEGTLYPNKYIINHCEEYLLNNYPDLDLGVIPHNGKRLNNYLESKGAAAVFVPDYNKIKKHMSQNKKLNKEGAYKTPLNQILFGAPGTGKTYNTKRIAVEIINGKKERTREEINAEYENLINSKQIVFTTFHQSLSYEDFIEGIKPILSTNNEEEFDNKLKGIEYEIKDGIFKRICDFAKSVSKKTFSDTIIDFDNSNYYKMSLGGKHRLEKHNWAIENDLIFLGWGDDNDFTELNKINDWKTFRNTFKERFPKLVEESSKFVIQAVYLFQKMKIGDIVIISKGNRIIDAIGIVESEYFYDNSKEIENYQFRKVKWIAKNLNISTDLFLEKSLSQQTIY